MIYVMSDIHGNQRRFDSVMKQINLQPEDTLYILGDVIDRYPAGIRIMRKIMAMPNAKMLLGNHEYMMLRALGHPCDDNPDDGRALEHWYRNGGRVTHFHLKCLRKTLRAEIIQYLLSLPVNIDIEVNGKPYKLVHATPLETYSPEPPYKNPIHFSIWKRWEVGEFPPSDVTVIFGHTPTRYLQDNVPMELWYGDRWIGIDCGSGYPENGLGRLACLRLDDGKVFYSEET